MKTKTKQPRGTFTVTTIGAGESRLVSFRIVIRQKGAKCEVWEEENQKPTRCVFSGGRVEAKRVALDGYRRHGYPVFNEKKSGRLVEVDCPPWDYFDSHNIAEAVRKGARQFKQLDAIATGGGCDFIIREWKKTESQDYCIAVLSSWEDSGCSPDHMSEPSGVTFYPDSDWQESLSFKFPTARAAMAFMDSPDLHPVWFNIPCHHCAKVRQPEE